MRLTSVFGVFALLTAAAVMSPPSTAQTVTAENWDAIVAKAKEEGAVVVHGAPGASYRAAMVTAFNATYPEIKVQFSGASNSVEIPKVIRERQAGIFAWDVWIAGPGGTLGQLKPVGFFKPLKPILRPELTRDEIWRGGFDFGWMDLDQELFFAFEATIQNPIMVNWDVVSPQSLTSLEDLLKPEFAGKIVWNDPRVTGSGNGGSQTLFRNLGEEKLRALYKNNVVYTLNNQQIGEWVVRGRYPIGIGLEPSTLKEFQDQGVGMNVSPMPDAAFKSRQISVGFGSVGLIDKAPHPNAAVVYINWLLSKEGQEAWVKVPRNSRRTDVVPAFPELMPKEGTEYFIGQGEKNGEERTGLLRVAKEAIDGSAGR
jgi:iron(III) transport system substrate-binding protein